MDFISTGSFVCLFRIALEAKVSTTIPINVHARKDNFSMERHVSLAQEVKFTLMADAHAHPDHIITRILASSLEETNVAVSRTRIGMELTVCAVQDSV